MAVNYAFFYMGIKWRSLSTEAYSYTEGTTNSSVSMQVVLLPNSVMCRSCSKNMMDTYYTWHPLTKKTGNSKKSRMTADNTWKLQNNWNTTLHNSLTGNDWLISIVK